MDGVSCCTEAFSYMHGGMSKERLTAIVCNLKEEISLPMSPCGLIATRSDLLISEILCSSIPIPGNSRPISMLPIPELAM